VKNTEVGSVRFCRLGTAAAAWLADDTFVVHTPSGSVKLTRAEACWLVEKLGELLELRSRQAAETAAQLREGRHGTC
jgi:hypothetical protein